MQQCSFCFFNLQLGAIGLVYCLAAAAKAKPRVVSQGKVSFSFTWIISLILTDRLWEESCIAILPMLAISLNIICGTEVFTCTAKIYAD